MKRCPIGLLADSYPNMTRSLHQRGRSSKWQTRRTKTAGDWAGRPLPGSRAELIKYSPPQVRALEAAVLSCKNGRLLILHLVLRLRREHAAKSVSYVAIIPIDHVAIRRLHLEAIARRPGPPAQHAPVPPCACAVPPITLRAPFPHVSAEVVNT